MKVYDIETTVIDGQKHCVVAENMAQAKRIFRKRYYTTTITNIHLHSELVQIQNIDE
jgi:predicted transposase YdaD